MAASRVCRPVSGIESSIAAALSIRSLAWLNHQRKFPDPHAQTTLQRVIQRRASSTAIVRRQQSARCVQAAARKLCMARRSEEHTSELQSRLHLVCRLLLEKKNK